MLPASAALVPIFERLFQMKLNGVNKLTGAALYHHLVATEIGCRQQLEAFGHPVELQAMILPDAQDSCAF